MKRTIWPALSFKLKLFTSFSTRSLLKQHTAAGSTPTANTAQAAIKVPGPRIVIFVPAIVPLIECAWISVSWYCVDAGKQNLTMTSICPRTIFTRPLFKSALSFEVCLDSCRIGYGISVRCFWKSASTVIGSGHGTNLGRGRHGMPMPGVAVASRGPSRARALINASS